LTPSDVVTAIGLAARRAAKVDDPGGEFERDQLSSVYSATRHLAAELEGYAPAFEAFRAAVVDRLRPGRITDERLETLVTNARDAVEREETTAALGALLADVLADLRGTGDDAALELRRDLQRIVRELADREVAILAEGLK
jgi:hypothetical protein